MDDAASLTGLSWQSPAFEITDADMSLMHTLAWMISDIHADEALMARSRFGGRLIAGPLVTAIMTGLFEGGTAREDIEARGWALGSLLTSQISYRAPVLAGAVLTSHAAVSEHVIGSDGAATIRVHDECCVDGRVVVLMDREYACEELAGRWVDR